MNRSIPATILAVIIIVLATGSGFAGDKEVVFDESFAVKAGDELKVTVGDMNVLLKTGKSNEAHVEVTVTGNLDKMRKRFEKMNFTAEIDDGALVLDTDNHNSWSINWWGSSGGGIHLTVTLPEKFDLHVQTSDGDISASGFEGDIELKTSDGDLIADPGETIEMGLTLINSTLDVQREKPDLENISITLMSRPQDLGPDRPIACVLDGSSYYGRLESGITRYNDPADPFRFVVGNVTRTSSTQVLQAGFTLGVEGRYGGRDGPLASYRGRRHRPDR